MKKSLLKIFSVITLISCGTAEDQGSAESGSSMATETKGFTELSPEQSGVSFINTISETESINALSWDAIYSGAGVGVGDFDGDGLQDIFLAGNQVGDALYRNVGGMEFQDVTSASGIADQGGWSMGVSIVDIDSDGDLDIYLCRNSGELDGVATETKRNKLFINQGEMRFTEESKAYGLDHEGYGIQAVFTDYDKDGDLDMYLVNSPSNSIAQKVKYNAMKEIPEYISDVIYRNDNGKFLNVTDGLGLRTFAYGLGVVASDLDHDGWVDIYVANDYERPDFMYINQRDGTFKNMLDQKMKHISYTSMGCDAADIDNDGLVDLAVVDMQSSDHYRSKTNMPSMDIDQFWSFVDRGYNYQYMSNMLQLNSGRGYFQEVAQYAGFAGTDWSWSVLVNDYDNDGNKDIFVTNGINKDLRNNDFIQRFDSLNRAGIRLPLMELSKELPSNPVPNLMFHAVDDYSFKDIASDWNLDKPSFSFGAAYADFDDDGDLDLVVNNNESPASVFRNDLGGSSIRVSVNGPSTNQFAYGTKVFLFKGEEIHYQELSPVRGYLSSSESMLHFGISEADSLICIFPDGRVIRSKTVEAARISLDHASATAQKVTVYPIDPPIFKDVTATIGLRFGHRENDHDDFANELLIPHSESRMGPCLAVGDASGDGLEDVFIGGAKGQSGAIFIQQEDGSFVGSDYSFGAQFEDCGAVFIDVENDGDMDLYVSSGGGSGQDPELFQDRLYIKDEHGHFHWEQNRLPIQAHNSDAVLAFDYDKDGDQDLVVAGRGLPLQYPRPGRTSLLRNDNGTFVDVTKSNAAEMEYIAMVTSIESTDLDDDGDEDIVLVGEWSQPTAFMNNGDGTFSLNPVWLKDFKDLTGWWWHVAAEDLNKDGKPDFIVGNIGINNKFKASKKKSLKVFQSDFDANATNDIVLAKEYNGKTVPTRGRECSSEQMPFIAEEFPTFEGFASADLESIIGDGLKEAFFREAKEFRSGLIVSSASGYEFKPFPALAQIAPIMGSVVDDFDEDGHLDLLIAGNFFDSEVETTRHDSGNGLMLKGNGTGEFEAVRPLYHGFYAPLNVRELAVVSPSSGHNGLILVAANNNRLTVYAR